VIFVKSIPVIRPLVVKKTLNVYLEISVKLLLVMLLATVSLHPNPVYLLVVVSLAFVILQTVLVLLLIPVMMVMPVRQMPVQMVPALTHK
jgi:hypothetical protein